MKRNLCSILLVFSLFLFGCDTRQPQATELTQTGTVPSASRPTESVSTTEPSESTEATGPSVYTTPPEGAMPILLYTQKGEDEAVANYLTWDVENGTFSDGVPWFTIDKDPFLDRIIDFWNGGSFAVVTGEPKECAPGIQVNRARNERFHIIYGSFCDMYDAEFAWYNLDGSKIDYNRPIMDVPADIFDAALPREAYYATLDNGKMIAAYSVYNQKTMESDMVTVTYPVEKPEAAIWKVTHIPFEYAVDVHANWNGAYWDGVLYMAALDTVLALDLENGELSELDAFDRIHDLSPEATQYDVDGTLETVRLVGCWDGILVAAYPQYLTDNLFHYYYIALRDGELLGFLDKNYGKFTFYNGDLEVIGTDNTYADTIVSLGIYFAKQS